MDEYKCESNLSCFEKSGGFDKCDLQIKCP